VVQGNIGYMLDKNERICGENLYAKHSIGYDDLKSYFYCFSIWDDTNYCLSWNDTIEFCQLLGIEHVPIIASGFLWEEKSPGNVSVYIEDFMNRDGKAHEGYVVRNADGFHYKDFGENVAKWVRPNHVTTSTHWMHSEVIPNKLIKTEV
jgi:hypothetical protein